MEPMPPLPDPYDERPTRGTAESVAWYATWAGAVATGLATIVAGFLDRWLHVAAGIFGVLFTVPGLLVVLAHLPALRWQAAARRGAAAAAAGGVLILQIVIGLQYIADVGSFCQASRSCLHGGREVNALAADQFLFLIGILATLAGLIAAVMLWMRER